mmetsp:Transcript_27284/g.31141  ORF Transcript_27284/g.31141 Transcript_27284/m.31141 type:complete len:84 (-) Transcript_27284:17-268(-)
MFLGWDPKNFAAQELLRGNKAIFIWTPDVLEKLNSHSMEGPCEEKQLVLIAYLAECCYEPCMSPNICVSESGGFESFGLRRNK